MLNATRGKGEFPLVRTFKPGMEQSTNSVDYDMDQAERWSVWYYAIAFSVLLFLTVWLECT